MSKVTVIFVHGDSIVDKIIDDVSKGNYSHVAIKIIGGTLEALGMKDSNDPYPGIWKHDINKYDNNPYVKMIDVELPDLPSAESEANSLIGKPYGYIDCVDGGAYDLTGKQLPADGELTANCSETVTRILRAGGFNILPDIEADCVTPMDLYRELTKSA
jgi:hypothetical protein